MNIYTRFFLMIIFISTGLSALTQNETVQWIDAINNNNIALIQELISHELINLKDKNGNAGIMIAAQKGYADLVEKLLDQRAHINLQNNEGNAALHFAAQNGHAYIAAFLLSRKADYLITNSKGNRPLDLDFIDIELLHAIRQHYQRMPETFYKQSQPQSPLAQRYLNELENNGIVKISGFIQKDELKQLQSDFDSFVKNVEKKVEDGTGTFILEEYWQPQNRLFITNNAFKYSTELARLSCNEMLLEIANHYLKKTGFIQRAQAMRYSSGGQNGQLPFSWHHDANEKRMKIMILLTDVGPEDQYMTYVLGSHKVFHSYEKFLRSKLSFDDYKEHLDTISIVKATGKAGDIFLFDSNGMHSGNRTNGRIRDAFFIEYTADKYNIWGGDLPEDFLKRYSFKKSNPFERFINVPHKKWEIDTSIRIKPKTILSLPHVELWI